MFVIQGEGRGHFTQAISLYEICKRRNIEVCAIWVGKSPQRSIPQFVVDTFHIELNTFESPNFLTDKSKKGILVGKSIVHHLSHSRKYLKEIRRINVDIDIHKPDVLVNFYEPLIGISQMIFNWSVPIVSIAHQYVYLHPKFEFPKLSKWQRAGLSYFTQITGSGSKLLLAISLYKLNDTDIIKVIPPLLRTDFLNIQPEKQDFILSYVLNAGYLNELIAWQAANPCKIVHCFTDSKDVAEYKMVNDNMHLHSLSDTKFLDMIAKCSTLASTAGFETVAEAIYLSKNIFMVPVAGHFEQLCNAMDVKSIGAGNWGNSFADMDLSETSNGFDYYQYKTWVDSAETTIIEHIIKASQPD